MFTAPFDEWAALLASVTGWDVTGAELRATARIVMAKRAYNIREGWRLEDDRLPDRLLAKRYCRAASGARAAGGPPLRVGLPTDDLGFCCHGLRLSAEAVSELAGFRRFPSSPGWC